MYKLQNYMEVLVDDMFDVATKDIEICRCDRCKADIMAIALNGLEPKYVVSDTGGVYIKLNMMKQQFQADVLSAIIRGALIVEKNCNHD